MLRIGPMLLLPLLFTACGEKERSLLAKKRECAAEGRRFFERRTAGAPGWTYAAPEFAYDSKRDSCFIYILAFDSPDVTSSRVANEELWDVLSNRQIAARITPGDDGTDPAGSSANSARFTNLKAEIFDKRTNRP